MTLGEKLVKLRKENNYTQEQLADLLEVSRQSISKWESDISYPETEKLIRISKMYNCSLDYLLKEEASSYEETDQYISDTNNAGRDYSLSESDRDVIHITLPRRFNKQSKSKINGIPLWHVTTDWRITAKGIFAVGIRAKGIISIGLISSGLISIGLFSLGIISLGALALGILSLGSIAAGIISIGAISIGILSVGAVAIGEFSVGAMAIGKYFALGDHANASIAIGKTYAVGEALTMKGYGYAPDANPLSASDINTVKSTLDNIVPTYLSWAKEILKYFL